MRHRAQHPHCRNCTGYDRETFANIHAERARACGDGLLVIPGPTRCSPELYDEVQRQLDRTVLVGMMD